LGVNYSPYYVKVLTEGTALRIPSAKLNQLIKTHPLLKVILDDYLAILSAQFAQAAVCNGLHQLQQRLSRLLLTLRDRLHSSTFSITQDQLAALLGVRRVGITRAASALLQREILFYSRGKMEILNHEALELIACNCYEIDKRTYQTLLPKNKINLAV
jgi:CRP-like cAMP-binding protein